MRALLAPAALPCRAGGDPLPMCAASRARVGHIVCAAGKEDTATILIRAGLKTMSQELSFADLKSLGVLSNSEKEGVLLEVWPRKPARCDWQAFKGEADKDAKDSELEQLDPSPPHLASLASEVVVDTDHEQLGSGLVVLARSSFLPASSHQCCGAAYQVDVVFRNTSESLLYMIEDHDWVSFVPSATNSYSYSSRSSWESSSRRTVHSDKVWHPLKPGASHSESFNVASFGAAARRYQRWLLRGTYTMQIQELGTEHWQEPTTVSVAITLDTPKWFRTSEE